MIKFLMSKKVLFSPVVFSLLVIGIIFFVLPAITKQISKDSSNKSQYNIVLISIDTLRPDHMGVYGYGKNTTPRIQAWSKNAFVFDNVYTSAPITYPSFVTLMTGEHPLRNNIVNNTVSSEDKETDVPYKLMSRETNTLAKILKSKGYITSAFVGNYALFQQKTNMDVGFDKYKSLFDWHFSDEIYESFIDESITWMGQNKNKKFFLWIHLTDPHAPYQPNKKYYCIFNKKYCDVINDETINDLERKRQTLQGCSEGVSREDISLFENLYDGEIRTADSLVGLILDAIHYEKLDNNTIVILYGDHGEGFDHNYNFVHGDMLYNSAIRIPLIIKYPGISPKQNHSKVLIENTDIFSTILDLLDISHPVSKDGISFSSIITGKKNANVSTRKYIFSVNKTKKRFSVYDGRYKYISTGSDNQCKYKNYTEELYDTISDAKEESNLALENMVLSNKMKKVLETYVNQFDKRIEKKVNTETNEDEATKDMLRSIGY